MFYPHAVYVMPLTIHVALFAWNTTTHPSLAWLTTTHPVRTHSGTTSSRKPPLTFPVSFLPPGNSNLIAIYIFSQHFVLDVCFLPNRL